MSQTIHITIDYREKESGIPFLLEKKGIETVTKTLKTGDYIVNERLCIERKTNVDFVLSIINHRLFRQCAKMKQGSDYQLLIIEGNPYKTGHAISEEAIRGGILSVSASWQIPVFFSHDKNDTVKILEMTGKQTLQDKPIIRHKAFRSKSPLKKQLALLQSLPGVGASLAIKLLKHFGTLENVLTATTDELQTIEKIGKTKAQSIRSFIQAEYNAKPKRK